MTGLSNLGNTCYMNSIIQCVTADTPFIKNILEIKETQDTPVILKTLKILIKGIYGGKYRIIKPSSFKRSIDYYLPKYNNKLQHDPHEFFTDFINLIDKNTMEIVSCKDKENVKNKLYQSWLKDIFMGKTSIVRDNYHGSMLLKYTCRSCGTCFYKFEEFTSIILHCQNNTSISKLINKYFEEDYAIVKCKDCCNDFSDGVEHEITKIFYNLPDTLCFVINKFKGETKKKCSVKIDEELDFCELYLEHDSSSYKFHSAVIHEGSCLNSGHFFSIVNNVIYDDEKMFNYKGDYSNLDCYIVFYKKL
jgi:ubiquitin carboxyl-terminal hydrolase 36/42